MAEPSKENGSKAETRSVTPMSPQAWRPFETFRQEIGRLLEDFDRDFWPSRFGRSLFEVAPFRRYEMGGATMPAVDITETDKAFEIKVELPGMSEKDIEVKATNDALIIKGEKQEEREEEKKDVYLRERRFGSFQRSFRLPESVDVGKIEANFKNGVLALTLPKTVEARKETKIEVKAA